MLKVTYPIIFIHNPETDQQNGYIPDLAIFADGNTPEEIYAEMGDLLRNYMIIALKYDADIPVPSTLDEVTRKWPGYKVSLVTAIIK
jgi:hypothetical protein